MDIPRIQIEIAGRSLTAALDSAANYNFIQPGLLPGGRETEPREIQLALQGQQCNSTAAVVADVVIGSLATTTSLLEVPGLQEEVLLGHHWLTTNQAVMDYQRGCLHIGSENRQTVFWNDRTEPEEEGIDEVNLQTSAVGQHKERLLTMLQRHRSLFSSGPLRTTSAAKHEIRLKEGSQPFRLPMYRYSDEKKRLIREQVEDMLRQRIIEPATSPYSSPVVIVKKKDSTPRFCVDFRRLNDQTEDVDSPLPLIYETIKDLSGAKVFSTLDLKSGYWQIPLEEDAKKYTAFSVPDGGRYQFRVMCFGLKNAPSTFQRLMQDVLTGLLRESCLVYLDDIIIFSPDWETHLRHLDQVLERLQMHQLTCSLSKCHFGREEVSFLGHEITPDGNLPQQIHLKAIEDQPAPRNKKELQRFLGTCNWLREYIPGFAGLSEPLTDLLRTRKWHWDETAQQAFEEVKAAFRRPLRLSRPDANLPMILQTDASQKGLGAVLYQCTEAGERRIISYASAKLHEAEKNYHSNELECLAVVWAIKKYRPYLEDRHFTLRTDNKALTWLQQATGQKTKYARWALLIQSFKFTTVHCPGKENELPDYLSREPGSEEVFGVQEEPRMQPEERPLRPVAAAAPRLQAVTAVNIHQAVQEAQEGDEQCEAWRNNPAAARAKRYRVDDGLVWKDRCHKSPGLYVPPSVRREVIKHFHDSPEAGHPGAEETFRAIGKDYVWTGLTIDVRKYVRGCRVCALHKRGANPEADQQRPRRPKKCWNTVALDIMGPYPLTRAGNRYIVVVTDMMSRWVEAKAVRKADADTIIRYLEEDVFPRWGYPEALLTDNGKPLTGNKWKQMCEKLHIQPWTTANYHPRANPTERRNGEIKKTLRILLHDCPDHGDWDKRLPTVLFSLRNRANAATGMTPSELLLGRDLQRPGDWSRPHAEQDSQPIEAREERARSNQSHYHQQRYPEQRTQDPTLAVGQRVYVKNHAGPAKGRRFPGWEAAWEGPFWVSAALGGQVYLVEKDGRPYKVHRQRIKPAGDEQ